MADNSWQADRIHAQYGMLRTRYFNDPNTFVAMALLLYYTEGEPADVAAPDVFVSRGVPNQHRDWYKVWEEGKAPDFALEVSSEQTAEDNLGRNMETYARIGISRILRVRPDGRVALSAPAAVPAVGRGSGGLRAREVARGYERFASGAVRVAGLGIAV